MSGTKALLLAFLIVPFLSAPTLGEEGRVVKQVRFPNEAATVVAAEGDLEPRSIGSYALRIYTYSNPNFPFDRFLTGVVRRRDGLLQDIRFADLDGQGSPEIIVVIRSAGSAGYLSADGFRFHDNTLLPLASVSGLPADADPIDALRRKLVRR